MASMWRVVSKTSNQSENCRILAQLSCRECFNNRVIAGSTVHLARCVQQNDPRYTQVRHMSDGRKGFIQSIYDNIKEGLNKDKKLNENLKKFREEKEKLETSDAIKKARSKFEKIEHETSKSSEVFKKGYDDVKEKVSETLEEVQKKEFIKKGMEIGEELGKTASKVGDTLYEQSKKIGDSAPLKTVQEGVKAVKQEFDETALSRARMYRPPSVLRMRAEARADVEAKVYEADDSTVDMVLHKDSKWHQSWQNFKDNNEYLNKVFEMKIKYDESDNLFIRATRAFTERVGYVFGGIFSKTEMSEVLTEICKMDPSFEKQKFVFWCQDRMIPNILEAIGQGNDAVLKDWCYEAPYNLLSHPTQTAKAVGNRVDIQVLDLSNVDIVAGKMMEQGPVLVITFITQQVMVVRNKKGVVVEGNPDQILRVTNIWALCRDQEELNPEAAWKIIDCSQSTGQQFL